MTAAPRRNMADRIARQSDADMAAFQIEQNQHPETHTIAEGML